MNNDWKEKALATAANLGKKIGMILLAMLVASLFLLIGGYDFFAVFKGVWIGITSDFAGTIRWTTPLLFASLAVCLSQKANLFNLGVDGQLYLGACTATFVALNIEGLPIAVSIAIIMASGMLGGMIFAAIPALAKIFFGAYEVVTTLLLNFVAIQLTSYLVLGPLKPTTLTGATATDTFPKQLWLPHILGTSDANVGIYIALIVAVLIAIIMYKTVFGQEVKMVGANERYAKYSGISTARITLFTMLIGGSDCRTRGHD